MKTPSRFFAGCFYVGEVKLEEGEADLNWGLLALTAWKSAPSYCENDLNKAKRTKILSSRTKAGGNRTKIRLIRTKRKRPHTKRPKKRTKFAFQLQTTKARKTRSTKFAARVQSMIYFFFTVPENSVFQPCSSPQSSSVTFTAVLDTRSNSIMQRSLTPSTGSYIIARFFEINVA